MLGKQSGQRGLWEADSLYIDHVGRGSFYGLLASMRGQLFRDEDFAELYCADNGRDSVPPSLLATALLLQTYDRASDAEAKQRADLDIRWKVALGIEVESRPFAKSTLQLFRARLILHEKAREAFERSLRFAREAGYLKSRRMKMALDTTYILGRGAVKDTYNLLSDGVVELMRVLSEFERSDLVEWAAANGYQKYVGSSVKGDACIDWDDKTARAALLGRIVGDADRLLELSRRAQGLLDEESAGRQRIVEASELLGQLLLQDVERTEEGVGLKEGVSRDPHCLNENVTETELLPHADVTEIRSLPHDGVTQTTEAWIWSERSAQPRGQKCSERSAAGTGKLRRETRAGCSTSSWPWRAATESTPSGSLVNMNGQQAAVSQRVGASTMRR